MNTPENYQSPVSQPEDEELNAAQKFSHFCGQPLTAFLSYYSTLGDPENASTLEDIKAAIRLHFQEFYARLHEHFDGDFTSVGNVTRENIDKLFEFEHRDPLEEGVLDHIQKLYQTMSPMKRLE